MTTYADGVRARARELWLAGGMTDVEIAALVGVARPNTVREWRRVEGWEELREAVVAATAARKETELKDARAQMNRRHDQLGEALEAMIVRAMKAAHAPKAAEIRALSSAMLTAQRIRRVAAGFDDVDEDGAPMPRLRNIRFTAGPTADEAVADRAKPDAGPPR